MKRELPQSLLEGCFAYFLGMGTLKSLQLTRAS